jgi:CRP-like cAMP-binding protein
MAYAMIAIMSKTWFDRINSLVERERLLGDGDVLFRAGEQVRYFYVVRSGSILLARVQPSGDPLVLQRATADQLVAEASVFAAKYHCDALASGPTLVGRIRKSDVEQLKAKDPVWLGTFAAHLAHEVQRARARAQLLSLKRVGARLDAWLVLNDFALPLRGRWVELAAELAVTPEALYRELAQRRILH